MTVDRVSYRRFSHGWGWNPRVVKAYLADHPEIVTEKLPSYALETNPDENVWQHTKHVWLANFAPEDTRELRRAMIEEFDRLHGRPDLLAAFIRHARIPVRLRRLSG